MQRGSAVIFVLIAILVLAGVAGGAFLIRNINLSPQKNYYSLGAIPSHVSPAPQPTSSPSASPDEAASWKTYSIDSLKLVFNYPSDWIVKLVDDKQTMKLCDLRLIIPNNIPKLGERFGACAATGVKPTVILTNAELLTISPKVATDDSYKSNLPIKLTYYENPDGLSIEDFNKKYLSETVAGDPVSVWASSYEKITNSNGITAYFDKEHYCVAKCQIYVWSQNDKIFILRNFPADIPNQNQIFQQVFNSVKSLDKERGGMEDQFCGGFDGKMCPEGLTCKLDGGYPDAGGKCTKN